MIDLVRLLMPAAPDSLLRVGIIMNLMQTGGAPIHLGGIPLDHRYILY
jgi:hypothetical protein